MTTLKLRKRTLWEHHFFPVFCLFLNNVMSTMQDDFIFNINKLIILSCVIINILLCVIIN